MSVRKRQRAMLEAMFRDHFAALIPGEDRGRALHALLTEFRFTTIDTIGAEEFKRRAKSALLRYMPLEPGDGR